MSEPVPGIRSVLAPEAYGPVTSDESLPPDPTAPMPLAIPVRERGAWTDAFGRGGRQRPLPMTLHKRQRGGRHPSTLMFGEDGNIYYIDDGYLPLYIEARELMEAFQDLSDKLLEMRAEKDLP